MRNADPAVRAESDSPKLDGWLKKRLEEGGRLTDEACKGVDRDRTQGQCGENLG